MAVRCDGWPSRVHSTSTPSAWGAQTVSSGCGSVCCSGDLITTQRAMTDEQGDGEVGQHPGQPHPGAPLHRDDSAPGEQVVPLPLGYGDVGVPPAVAQAL